MTTVAIEVEFPVDVKMLAKQFASLPDHEQAEFFHEVQRYAEATFKNGEYGAQCQWACLAQQLLKDGHTSPGWRFVCDLGAFTMVHTYDWASKNLCPRYSDNGTEVR